MKKIEIEVEDNLAEMLEDLSKNSGMAIEHIVSLCLLRRITINSDFFYEFARKVRREEKIKNKGTDYTNLPF